MEITENHDSGIWKMQQKEEGCMAIENVCFVIGAALILVMLKFIKWGEPFNAQLMINI